LGAREKEVNTEAFHLGERLGVKKKWNLKGREAHKEKLKKKRETSDSQKQAAVRIPITLFTPSRAVLKKKKSIVKSCSAQKKKINAEAQKKIAALKPCAPSCASEEALRSGRAAVRDP